MDSLPQSPLALFSSWYADFQKTGPKDPTPMTLATATKEGRPSARIVLMKGYDESGFTFFTNFESRKSLELSENPRCELLFFWEPLARQVRIEGVVIRVSDKESDEYFSTRHPVSQLGAWASKQSSPLKNREELLSRVDEFKLKFGEGPVPRPPHWGGWRVVPSRFEFWQGRENRLHDRYIFEKSGSLWKSFRIFP